MGFVIYFAQNLLYHIKDTVLCKMIMEKRKPWWTPLFGSIYFSACYEIQSIFHTGTQNGFFHGCVKSFIISAAAVTQLSLSQDIRKAGPHGQRDYILLKQAMYQKKSSRLTCSCGVNKMLIRPFLTLFILTTCSVPTVPIS